MLKTAKHAIRAIVGKTRITRARYARSSIAMADILRSPLEATNRTLTECALYTYAADVEGDIAEFGTASGFTAHTIATVIAVAQQDARWKGKKRLHLFDSFAGLPEVSSEIDAQSPHVKAGLWAAGACKILSLSELKAVIASVIPDSLVSYYPGWFSDTASKLPPDCRLAMIHVDGDLYQSAMDALVPCFSRGMVSEGAVICFDDWNCNRASDRFGERRAWKELVEKYDIRFSYGGDYSWVSSRMIVHSYTGMPEPIETYS